MKQRFKLFLRLIERLLLLLRYKLSPLTKFLFPSELVGEFDGIYNGIVKNKDEDSLYNFVRNIHRIEKGLTFKNRREVFALDYISDTIAFFVKNKELLNRYGYLEYSRNILASYFNYIPDEYATKEKDKFKSCTHSVEDKQRANQDLFTKQRLDHTEVDQMCLERLILRRRSIRNFTNLAPRDINIIKRLCDLSVNAPSACNRLPYKYICLQGDLKNKALEIPMGTAGWSENVGIYVIVVGDLRAYFDIRDRHAPYIDASLALMQLVLLLEVNNYATCIVNWSDIPSKNRKIKKLLGLESHEIVITTLAIGGKPNVYSTPISQKRSLYEFRS